MKAAVIHAMGTIPAYETFPDPVPGADELIITVKAAALKQLDKSRVSGKHYTKFETLPAVVGVDGAGVLEDGTRVYAIGETGMMAGKALVRKEACIPLPDEISFEMAAALPNALLGSDAALLCRGGIQAGHTVWVNGATGVSGKMAVQAAKLRGAARVIATGRNPVKLEALKALGADEVVCLQQNDEALIAELSALQAANPVDIVIDYLWGRPMELLLQVLKQAVQKTVKIVTVGEMAGASINLPSGILRSKKIELLGSGFGSISKAEIYTYFHKELPGLYRLAAAGQLRFDIETASLQDVSRVWEQEAAAGSRWVFLT